MTKFEKPTTENINIKETPEEILRKIDKAIEGLNPEKQNAVKAEIKEISAQNKDQKTFSKELKKFLGILLTGAVLTTTAGAEDIKKTPVVEPKMSQGNIEKTIEERVFIKRNIFFKRLEIQQHLQHIEYTIKANDKKNFSDFKKNYEESVKKYVELVKKEVDSEFEYYPVNVSNLSEVVSELERITEINNREEGNEKEIVLEEIKNEISEKIKESMESKKEQEENNKPGYAKTVVYGKDGEIKEIITIENGGEPETVYKK